MSICYYCGSDDSMTPFRREEHVFLLSRLLRRLRWRYCRACTRHYMGTIPDRAPAADPTLIVPAPSRRRRRVV